MPVKVLIVIILLLVLLLRLPVGVDAGYTEGQAFAGLRIGPKVFWLYPRKERPPTHGHGKRKKIKTEAEAPSKAKRSPRSLNLQWDEIKSALDLTVRCVKKLRFRLRRLDLRFVSGGADPYNTAMAYGYANAAADALGLYRLKQANVELSADFTAERSEFDGACSVTIRVYYLCKFGITMAVGGLRLLLRHRKRVKQEQRAAALIPGKEG